MAILTEALLTYETPSALTVWMTYNDANGRVSSLRVVNTTGWTGVFTVAKDPVGQAGPPVLQLEIPGTYDETFDVQGAALTYQKLTDNASGWGVGIGLTPEA